LGLFLKIGHRNSRTNIKMVCYCMDKKDMGSKKKVTCSAFGKPKGGFLFLKISYIVPDRQVIFVQFSF